MLTSLLAVMRKEFIQAFRNRPMTVMLLVAPLLQTTVLGFAVDLDVDRIPTAVVDQDRSPASRALAAAFVADRTFAKVAEGDDAEAASRLLERGAAAAALVIPPGFERDVNRGTPTQVQLLVDGTDPNRAQISGNAASQFLLERGLALSMVRIRAVMAAQGRTGSVGQARILPRTLYNPRFKSAVFMVPGVASVVLLVVTTIVTAMGLAREREMGTMEQILVTPLDPGVLLVGKCLPFAILGLVDMVALLVIGNVVFGVPLRGPLPLVFAGTLLYLMSTLGVGIFISTVSKSQQQAVLGGFFFLMPAVLLGGFMTPIENMPAWIQPITWLNPVRYFIDIMRSCLLKGAGFREAMPNLAALAVFGTAILGISTLRFHKRLG